MDLHEMNILEMIQKHDYLSQREMSEKAELSLGMVNQLLKRFLKMGFLKAEQVDGRKIRYLLTVAGRQYLSRLTIDRASRSYHEVLKLKSGMAALIDRYFDEGDTIPILATRDEVMDMLIELLEEQGRRYDIIEQPRPGVRYVGWTYDEDVLSGKRRGMMINMLDI